MRAEPEVIGPKWAIRFSDLSGWHRIECKCFACDHVAEFAPEQFKQARLRQLRRTYQHRRQDEGELRRLIANERVADLEDRLSCTHCGNRRNNNLRVIKLPRNT
jgi:hypothetical protein